MGCSSRRNATEDVQQVRQSSVRPDFSERRSFLIRDTIAEIVPEKMPQRFAGFVEAVARERGITDSVVRLSRLKIQRSSSDSGCAGRGDRARCRSAPCSMKIKRAAFRSCWRSLGAGEAILGVDDIVPGARLTAARGGRRRCRSGQ